MQQPFNYLTEFPLPVNVIPPRLKNLLTPIGFDPDQHVEVGCMFESDPHGDKNERLNLMMTVVLDGSSEPIEVQRETVNGVVMHSVPVSDQLGCISDYIPSISGYDYIVASCGDGSFYSFNLAEKVWMSLGLTPRCEGNERQYIIYDDLSAPLFSVAEGEISSSYYWNLQRNVSWKMRNEHLRRYLWMRGARGVRVFFYEALLDECFELRSLMNGEPHISRKPMSGIVWYDLDIREHQGKILLQVWASVEAVAPELCPQVTADGIIWKGMTSPMNRRLADSLIHYDDANSVYLDDAFLQRYEQNDFYECVPFLQGGFWYCNPSYRGQWGFSRCCRVGRNLVRTPIRELYKGVPDREILHAYKFAIDPKTLSSIDVNEEHIVSKTQRFIDMLLRLGNGLALLGNNVDLSVSSSEWVRIDRAKLHDEGWIAYPVFCRLSQVVPLNMSKQSFLDRCKVLHEIIVSSIPHGHLRSLLECAGCKRESLEDRKSLKLLEALLNILEPLNEQCEKIVTFGSKNKPENFQKRNDHMAMLFLNNDLRNADAHASNHMWISKLQGLGFDTASLSVGYGKAFDFVFDGAICSLQAVSMQIEQILSM